jgi:thiol-disulfide isomerase/thioredoxin
VILAIVELEVPVVKHHVLWTVALAAVFSISAIAVPPGIVETVRGAIARNDFAGADKTIRVDRAAHGVTSEMIQAVSWIARGELAAKNLDAAEKYADETYQLSREQLKKRPLDQDSFLPIALGAAIEVQANVFAARGERSQAVAYLHDQLKAYYATSIRARIQKNLNLLTMEGKPAPRLEGVALPKGKPVLLFFWAHWCGDCKGEAPILAQIKSEFGTKGLAIVAPTQKYGYVAGGESAPADAELRYIEQVRQRYYAPIITTPAPVNEENFRNYGASTTPTLVLVDRAGVVRLYHPGTMTYEELRSAIQKVIG